MADNFISDSDFGISYSSTVELGNEALDLIFGDEAQPIVKKQEPKKEEKKEDKQPLKKSPSGEENEEVKEDVPDFLLGEEDLPVDEEAPEEGATSTNVFGDLAEELYNIGVFTEDEEGVRQSVTSPEEFRNLFELQKKMGANDVLDQFLNRKGEEAREVFDALIINGVNPKTYLEKYVSIQDIESMDLENEANQEKIVRELYKRNGAKRIDDKIQKLKDYTELKEEAEEAKEIILEQDRKSIEDEKLAAKEKELRKVQIKQDQIQNIGRILNDKIAKKEFDGIPVSRQFAQEVGDDLTRGAYKTPDGEVLTTFEKELSDLNRPENYELKVKMAMLLKIIKTDPTLSVIQKNGVSKESSSLFQKVAQQKVVKNIPKKEEAPKSKSWFTQQ